MSIEETVIKLLNDLCGAEEGELQPDLDLFEAGLLDSFGVLQLFTELEAAFGVSLPIEAFSREQLATAQKIAALVREKTA